MSATYFHILSIVQVILTGRHCAAVWTRLVARKEALKYVAQYPVKVMKYAQLTWCGTW